MPLLRNAWGHFRTINHHKWEVLKNCFRIGLYRQGLLHDLSKYSPTEFRTGICYYKGTQSPNGVERLATGVSPAWLHHKGRNKHHFEYWVDYDLKDPNRLIGCRMPYRYVAEMFCDRVAACKVYRGKDYRDSCPWEYFRKMEHTPLLHEKTREELIFLLKLLRDEGEKAAFDYLRGEVRRRRRERDYF